MSSAFERLQKIAEEKRKARLEVVEKKEIQPLLHTAENIQPLPSSTNPSQVVPTSNNLEPVSPKRNFTKVANSITNEAIPKGLFKGLSKHTYDVLYKLTRGAIKPSRFIQITQRELMRLTGLSENTLRSHIKYLSASQLIVDTPQLGKHEGTIYEVFVPEEVVPSSTKYPHQVVPRLNEGYQPVESSHSQYQNLVPDTSQDVSLLGTTKTIENKGTYENANTFINTIKNDDDLHDNEAFSILNERLNAAVMKITGKSAAKSEAGKWGMLADLLILELEVAASRADNISSVPSFLTEVLRRQFFSARRQEQTQNKAFTKGAKAKKDKVGKTELPYTEDFKIKALNETERNEALLQLQEFAGEEFLQDFKKWYTPEDWEWLSQQLAD